MYEVANTTSYANNKKKQQASGTESLCKTFRNGKSGTALYTEMTGISFPQLQYSHFDRE